MSTTAAMRVLKQKKIPFELREYDHKVKGAEFAAQALNWPLSAMVKTLVVKLDGKSYILCCMPGNRELSLKKVGAGGRSEERKHGEYGGSRKGHRLSGWRYQSVRNEEGAAGMVSRVDSGFGADRNQCRATRLYSFPESCRCRDGIEGAGLRSGHVVKFPVCVSARKTKRPASRGPLIVENMKLYRRNQG